MPTSHMAMCWHECYLTELGQEAQTLQELFGTVHTLSKDMVLLTG